jgi:hypothetical protein
LKIASWKYQQELCQFQILSKIQIKLACIVIIFLLGEGEGRGANTYRNGPSDSGITGVWEVGAKCD